MIKVEETGRNFIKVHLEGDLDILKIAKRQVEELEKQLKEHRND